jgi:hypothetical protein
MKVNEGTEKGAVVLERARCGFGKNCGLQDPRQTTVVISGAKTTYGL